VRLLFSCEFNEEWFAEQHDGDTQQRDHDEIKLHLLLPFKHISFAFAVCSGRFRFGHQHHIDEQD
jgi:hypothetical protein